MMQGAIHSRACNYDNGLRKETKTGARSLTISP